MYIIFKLSVSWVARCSPNSDLGCSQKNAKPLSYSLRVVLTSDVVVVVVYPTPSEGWGHGGRPWSPRNRATPQGLDQRS